MEFRNLKTFQIVSENLNMTKAAEILKYTQPTITLQIQSLERELNQSLFTRIGNKIHLTPAGMRLKEHADKLFELLAEIEKDLKEFDGPSGNLTIAASEYYCTHHLSLLLSAYTKLHPKVKLRLEPANSLIVIQKILKNEVDIGIIANNYDEQGIQSHVLEEERAVLVVAAEIFNKHSREQIFSNYPFLAYHEHCGFSKLIDQCFIEINFRPVSIIDCGGSDETIKRAVLNKTGIALLGENVIHEELLNGQLIPLFYFNQPIETSIIYLKNCSQDPTIQSFDDLVKDTWNTLTN